jgi:queuine tRNA-ribosyltransferase
VKSGELLGMMLLSWANIAYYQELVAGIRAAIEAGRYADFSAATKDQWRRGDDGLE